MFYFTQVGLHNIHPTFHITNIIRNGAESLNERQKKELEELGLVFKESKVIVQKPDYLDQTYETEHYRFPFTLDSTSINKVESFDYRFSNLCNFSCRMCGDMLSSSW